MPIPSTRRLFHRLPIRNPLNTTAKRQGKQGNKPSKIKSNPRSTRRRNGNIRNVIYLSPFLRQLKKNADEIFTKELKTNKYFRINVCVECFHLLNTLIRKIDLREGASSDEIIDAIILKLVEHQKPAKTRTNLKNMTGGANFRDIIKFLYLLAMAGLMIIILSNGIPRCEKTATAQMLIKNTGRFMSQTTKCKRVELPYFSIFVNQFVKTTAEKQFFDTLYSISLCDEYTHLGHEEYCKKNTCYYPKQLLDDAKNAFSKMMPETVQNVAQSLYDHTELFSYMYAGNIKTDIATMRNDAEICYNNVVSPLLWLTTSSVTGFMFLFSVLFRPLAPQHRSI